MSSLLLRKTRDNNRPSVMTGYEKEESRSKRIKVVAKGYNKDMEIPWLWDKLDPKYFINKSTVFYGGSGTGKTFLITDFLYLLKRVFYAVIVFAPTNKDNKSYDKKIPDSFIHETMDIENLRSMFKHQSQKTAAYSAANEIDNLESLFFKVASVEENRKMAEIRGEMKIKLQKNKRLPSEEREDPDDIKKYFDNVCAALCKRVIRANKASLRRMSASGKLTKLEKNTLENHDINPKMLVIFDDAIMELVEVLKEGKKTKDDVLKNFFFKGRHKNMTFFYAMQDDTKMGPDIRKNVHISVFTDSASIRSYFMKGNTGHGEIRKKQADVIARELLDEDENAPTRAKKNEKVIFIKDMPNPWYYYKAKRRGNFKAGSKIFHDIGERIKKEDCELDDNNVFYKDL